MTFLKFRLQYLENTIYNSCVKVTQDGEIGFHFYVNVTLFFHAFKTGRGAQGKLSVPQADAE